MNRMLLSYIGILGSVLLLVFWAGAVLAFQGDMNQVNSQFSVQLVRFQSNASGQHTTSPGSIGNPGLGNSPVPQTKKLSPPEMRACFDSCMTSGLGTGPGGSNAKFCAKSCH